MAHDTARQPTGETFLIVDAAAPLFTAPAPSVSSAPQHVFICCGYVRSAARYAVADHTWPAHYTTLGSGPSFRERCLCSMRSPHLCGGIVFQHPSTSPRLSYLRAIFVSCLAPLRDVPSTDLLSSAVAPLREPLLPSSVINAAVAPLRSGLLLIIALDFPAWAQDAHLLDALLRALLCATQPSSVTQLPLLFSPSPSLLIDAAVAASRGGTSFAVLDARSCASDAQLCVLCALFRAMPRASWRPVDAQPRVRCASSLHRQLFRPSSIAEPTAANVQLRMRTRVSSDTLASPLMQCASPLVFVSPLALLGTSLSPFLSSHAMLPSVASFALLAPSRGVHELLTNPSINGVSLCSRRCRNCHARPGRSLCISLRVSLMHAAHAT